MGTGVVGDIKLTIDVEDCDGQAAGLNPKCGSGGDLIRLAKLNFCGHFDVSCMALAKSGNRRVVEWDYGCRFALMSLPRHKRSVDHVGHTFVANRADGEV